MQLEQRVTGEAPRARSVAGNVIRGSLGNLIEWYDWYAYAAFSIYFAGVFFPSGSPTAQLLNTAGIFAVGFLIRPLGGWLFGRYADRFGRRAALTLSVTMMGVGSLGIAVLPGYAQIGALAPMLLVAARLLKGLSLGGEYGSPGCPPMWLGRRNCATSPRRSTRWLRRCGPLSSVNGDSSPTRRTNCAMRSPPSVCARTASRATWPRRDGRHTVR